MGIKGLVRFCRCLLLTSLEERYMNTPPRRSGHRGAAERVELPRVAPHVTDLARLGVAVVRRVGRDVGCRRRRRGGNGERQGGSAAVQVPRRSRGGGDQDPRGEVASHRPLEPERCTAATHQRRHLGGIALPPRRQSRRSRGDVRTQRLRHRESVGFGRVWDNVGPRRRVDIKE